MRRTKATAPLTNAAMTLACALAGTAVLDAASGSPQTATPKTLQLYFIDVEGGQSTLVVTPDRHSLLIDTGYAGAGLDFHPGDPTRARDANRIVAAARDAGITRIDYLLITHFHADHDGGVSELSQLMPIRVFVDHGAPGDGAESTSEATREAFKAYAAVRSKGHHLQPRAADRLPLEDLEVLVVSSAGSTLGMPLPDGGAINAGCHSGAIPPDDPYENPRSTGIVVRYGKFRFLDLGDLTGQTLFDLVCPKDLIGPVDAYLVAHHGGPDVDVPRTFAAFKPRVAIVNNGPRKGGAVSTLQALHQVPGLEGVWQLHISAAASASNFPAKYVANLDESTAHWIKLVANADGSFRVFNQRTGKWKGYSLRKR